MTSERPARRYAAHSFPEIQGVRLVPQGAAATLVNLSETGVLVECETRLLPGVTTTVEFAGTFTPASIQCRVIRCEIIGIAANGSMGYRIGLAFSTRIALPNADEADVRPAAPVDVPPAAAGAAVVSAPPVISPPAVISAPAVVSPPVLRNRW
jgi:hypothetical protein